MNGTICSTLPGGTGWFQTVSDPDTEIMSKTAAYFMKKSTKIFITHFHKTFYLVIKRTFLVNFVVFFFNLLPCTPVLTLGTPCTLFISSQCLRSDVSSKDSTHILQQVVTLQWSLSTVYSEMNGQPVGIQKKQNAFSA